MSDERIYPADLPLLSDLSVGHRFRYLLARGFLKPFDKVVDAACGPGYGSEILSQIPDVRITGLDYSSKAIDYAKTRHASEKIDFEQKDLDEWEPTKHLYDVAVSFETIEHLVQDPKVFAAKLKNAASRMIIISAPIIPTVGVNPYHKHDLTDDQMVELFHDAEWMLFEKVKQRVYGIYVFVRREEAGEVR